MSALAKFKITMRILGQLVQDQTAILVPYGIHCKFACLHQCLGTRCSLKKFFCLLVLTLPTLLFILNRRSSYAVIAALF